MPWRIFRGKQGLPIGEGYVSWWTVRKNRKSVVTLYRGHNLLVQNKQTKKTHPVRTSASCPYRIAQVELSLHCVCKPIAEMMGCTGALLENQVRQHWSLISCLATCVNIDHRQRQYYCCCLCLGLAFGLDLLGLHLDATKLTTIL